MSGGAIVTGTCLLALALFGISRVIDRLRMRRRIRENYAFITPESRRQSRRLRGSRR